MGKVIPEIFDVFAPDAEAQQTRRKVLLAGQFGPALDGAFDPAEAGR